MIIWSGLGILVIVSLIVGFVLSVALTSLLEASLGPSASNYGLALSILMAALINWVFTRLLNQKEAKLLMDPKTGATYQVRRNDSLFFIPMGAFTYIFLMLGAVMMIPAFLSSPVPEFSKAELERRDSILSMTGNDGGSNHGNTRESNMAAALFQRLMVKYNGQAFENREFKIHKNTENFTTYCLQKENLALFVTDINDYRAYHKSEVKDLFADLLWRSGQEAAKRIGIRDDGQLIVVVRKGSDDKMILSGSLSSKPARNTGFVESNRLVYLFDEQSVIFEVEAENIVDSAKPNDIKNETSKNSPNQLDSAFKSIADLSGDELKSLISQERLWTDTKGRQFEGTFVQSKEKSLYFSQNGVTHQTPLISLSEPDQELIDRYLELFPNKDSGNRGGRKFAMQQLPTQKKTLKEKPSTSKNTQTTKQSEKKATPLSIERSWIDIGGREMIAKYLALEGENVIFEKKGKTYRFPLAKLSPSDQKLIREKNP